MSDPPKPLPKLDEQELTEWIHRWREASMDAVHAAGFLLLNLPFREPLREHMVAFARVLGSLLMAVGDDDHEYMQKLGSLAAAYLRDRSVAHITHNLFRGGTPPTYFDVEAPRHIVALTLRMHFHLLAAFPSYRDPAFHAEILGNSFFNMLHFPCPEIIEHLVGLGVESNDDLYNRNDLRERVRSALEKHLRSTPAEDNRNSEEYAERLVVEAFIALGVRETIARGLFRFEDQRHKRGNPKPPSPRKPRPKTP